MYTMYFDHVHALLPPSYSPWDSLTHAPPQLHVLIVVIIFLLITSWVLLVLTVCTWQGHGKATSSQGDMWPSVSSHSSLLGVGHWGPPSQDPLLLPDHSFPPLLPESSIADIWYPWLSPPPLRSSHCKNVPWAELDSIYASGIALSQSAPFPGAALEDVALCIQSSFLFIK